jgi:hypothetical protein
MALFTKFQKFFSGSPKSLGIYMWLYTEKSLAPQRTVASKKGDLRICVPKPKSFIEFIGYSLLDYIQRLISQEVKVIHISILIPILPMTQKIVKI